MLVFGCLVQGVGGADTRHNVLALGIDEPLAIEFVLACGGVAAEGDAGGAGLAHIAEYHRLYGHCGAPVIGNTLDVAVCDGALAVPGFEHGADAAPQLGACIIGELLAQNLKHPFLEGVAEGDEVLFRELCVKLVSLGSLYVGHHSIQLHADALAVFGLDALGLLHDDVGVHHNQTAVCIVYETGVLGLGNKTGDGGAAQTYVEHGLHHAGH